MKNRLRRSEREAIGNEYGDNAIYLALKNPCEHFRSQMAKFRLSAEETFWECLAVLDDIKEDEGMAKFKMEHLWDRIYNDFKDLSEDGTEEEELELAVSEVVFCACMCLMMTERPLHNTLAMKLMMQMDEHNACTEELKNTFMNNVYRLGVDKLNAVVVEYMESDEFLSGEIDDMVRQHEENEEKQLDTSLHENTVSDLKIAKGKETAVLVVLECMYKAKWFVDKNDNPVTNKEKTLKQIMHYAFNKPNANVKQLLTASTARKLSDNQDFFDELMEFLPKKD